MQLQLRYDPDTHLPAHAVLLHGSNATAWLKQVSLWGVPAADLSCYIIPASVHTEKPAGLFVVFHNPEQLKLLQVLDTYSCIGKRLFIPCNTTLVPQVTLAELERSLVWAIQVFHPSIGLVGFEEISCVDLHTMFVYPELKPTRWDYADPGLAAKPPLEQIFITPVSAETMMQEIKGDIGQKPIKDIVPPKDKKNRILNWIKLILLLPVLLLLRLLAFFTKPRNIDHSGRPAGKPGLLQQFKGWVEQSVQDLQKKRDKELKRLSDMFDKDINEALQYAIPLNSPYLDRGKAAAPSSTLSRRWANFNLGGLGGGGAVDVWDTSNYYDDLRTKYLRAAQKEIDQQNYKKAAYVYAHLLGDYYNAARVLENGGLYREAAALHKDHLKNKPAAAQCLEKGGLYTEAIDLYKELKEEEKVGDLYTQIGQQQHATTYYEYSVEKKIANDNMLDAARVLNEKMLQEDRAKDILLQGWKGNYEVEPCLKKYFSIIMQKEDADIPQAIQEVYTAHTTEKKALPLLHVLEYVHTQAATEPVLQATQEIAYDVLHKEAVKGNTQNLHHLKKFLPGNKLIASDTSRYISSHAGKSLQQPPAYIHLDNSIAWKKASWFRNQFIAVGFKNEQLHMARANWYGNVEYYSWETAVKPFVLLNFITPPYGGGEIILHSTADTPVDRKTLSHNKYFSDSLQVHCPVWLHGGTAQFLLNGSGGITRISIERGDMTLQQYSMEGTLLNAVNCVDGSGETAYGSVYSNPALCFNDGYYYSYTGMRFLTVSHAGQVKGTDLYTGIRLFAASTWFNATFYIVISTNKGCTLCKPDKGELNFTGVYFAEKLIPLSIEFISSNRFVIAEKMRAAVFDIAENGQVSYITHVDTASPIAAVLPAGKRHSFAILEENGNVNMHSPY